MLEFTWGNKAEKKLLRVNNDYWRWELRSFGSMETRMLPQAGLIFKCCTKNRTESNQTNKLNVMDKKC